MSQGSPTKVINEQKSILYICLSSRWGTLERRLLKDALISQDNGFSPLLMVSRESLLEKKAIESGLHVVHSQASLSKHLWKKRIQMGKEILKLAKKNKIGLVHCYDYPLIWPISFALQRYPLIPFILSENIEIKKFYTTPWRRLLTNRIDHVILSTPFLEENVEVQLGLRKGKINVLGLGISEEQLKSSEAIKRPKEEIVVGAVIGPHLTSLDAVYPLFRAFLGVAQEMELEETLPIKLHLFMELGWERFSLFEEFKRYILENGLGERVVFRQETSIAEQQRSLDIWIGGQELEEIEDYTVTSLIQGTPVLVPRKPSTMDLFYRFPDCGETYRIDDARELRHKCLKIIRALKRYQKFAGRASVSLFEEHQVDHYRDRLMALYQKQIKKRRRLMSRRLQRV